MTSQSYFGTDSKPCASETGIAKWTATFDEHDIETSRSNFDRLGRPVWPLAIQINAVLPNGKEAVAGLMAHDVIVRYDGQAYTDVTKLIPAIGAPGDKPRELVVSRDGKAISFELAPGKLGLALGPLYLTAAPESPTSTTPATKPAVPSSLEFAPHNNAK
jgi:hypothetical protein